MTKGDQALPETCPAAAGPSARAAVPSFCKGDAGRTAVYSGRGASGEDAALTSAFGLPCDKLTALSRAEGRLTQTAEESTSRTGGPERHDRVLFPPCLTEPQRARRRRRRRRPRRLPSRTPCPGAGAFPSQNGEGGLTGLRPPGTSPRHCRLGVRAGGSRLPRARTPRVRVILPARLCLASPLPG